MKLQKAINIVKKSPSILLWYDESTATQMISNGYAAYDVSGWPCIETESELAAILGIDDTDKHTFTIGALPDNCKQRPGGTYVERLYTVVEYGDEYEFFDIGGGEIIAVRQKVLSPFGDDVNYKYHKDGNIIEVGEIIAEGYVMPMKIDDGLKEQLSRIVKGLK